MKNPGELVCLMSVRPGERMHGRSDVRVVSQNNQNTRMMLAVDGEPKMSVEVCTVKDGETLHDDPLAGPPMVEVKEVLYDSLRGGSRTVSSRAFFYDLGDVVFLILT